MWWLVCRLKRLRAELTDMISIKSNMFSQNNKTFVPWGLTYFPGNTGWPPQMWKRFAEYQVEKDLVRL